MKQKLIKLQGYTDESTIIMGGFNKSLPIIDRQSRQKLIKYIHNLNTIISQLDVVDIYRILHPTSEYTCL